MVRDGIQGIARRALLGGLLPITDDRVLYYVVLAIFLFGYFCIYRFIHSPFGQVLKAIRDNEPRAVSLGYEADRYKLLAFVLSAALAGLAGRHQGDGCCSSRRSPTSAPASPARSC